MMKKLGFLILFVLVLAGAAQARYISAEWNTWEGALSAERDSFGDLTAVMPADAVMSDPEIPDMIANGYLFYSDLSQEEYPDEYKPFLYDSYGQGTDEKFGVLELNADGQLIFELDNYAGGYRKELFIAVTYYDQGVESVIYPVAQSEGIVVTSMDFLGYEIDGKWVTDFWQIIYEPNPSWEAFGIDFAGWPGTADYPALIDSIVIESECIPEPATVGLLSLGTLVGIFRRK